MRYYTVHLPGTLSRGVAAGEEETFSTGQALGDAVLMREGFNWLACFFSIPWAIANGLWLCAVVMATALALIVGLPEIFAPDWRIRAVLLVGYAVICGFGGNDWRRLGLSQAGWGLVSVIAARDRADAFLRFGRLLDEDKELPAPHAPPARPRIDLGPNPGFWS